MMSTDNQTYTILIRKYPYLQIMGGDFGKDKNNTNKGGRIFMDDQLQTTKTIEGNFKKL